MADAVVAEKVLKRSLRREWLFVDRLNPLEVLRSEEDVRARYRFYRSTIYSIMRLIFEDITRPTQKSMALPLIVILCSALHFFASGSLYLVLWDCLLISPASMCRCVHTVSEALVKKSKDFIRWPSVGGMERLKERFYDIAGDILTVLSLPHPPTPHHFLRNVSSFRMQLNIADIMHSTVYHLCPVNPTICSTL